MKELSVSVARWLVQGAAVEIRPLCRQGHANNEVRASDKMLQCSSRAPQATPRLCMAEESCQAAAGLSRTSRHLASAHQSACS